jgi:hypothetical protein
MVFAVLALVMGGAVAREQRRLAAVVSADLVA